MDIRNERPADIEAITAVTVAAFETHPHSQNTEQFILHALRAAGALTVSLVAEVDGAVAGHIAFSPVTIEGQDYGWYGLGPVSVMPSRQGQGIGAALVREGLDLLRARGAHGCALVGEPGFYGRFGFKNNPELVYEGIPQEYFLVLPFGKEVPEGVVVFHEAFHAQA